MSTETIDGLKLKQMIAGGAASLNRAKEEINSLNVFPVPDGDTGTNMNLTMQSAKEEAEKVNSNHAGEVAKAISKGALMGARGNSGVILSQLFRGFAKELEKHSEIDTKLFVKSMSEGVNTAYRAVMKPVEGTILTVAKEAAKGGQKFMRDASAESGYSELLQSIINKTNNSVQKTPQQLPVLKEAGVVDAGGKGLYYIYCGFLSALAGDLDESILQTDETKDTETFNDSHDLQQQELVYQFCTEFILTDVKNPEETEQVLKRELTPLGDSMLVVAGGDLVKIHIHTNRPGKVLDDAMRFGELNDIKIDNMKQQHESTFLSEEKSDGSQTEVDGSDNTGQITTQNTVDQVGVISVVSGDGFADIFRSLGVSDIVVGGQTMNPSTEDLLTAIENTKEEKLVLLPNNKNIIMACEQVQKISDKEIIVIPTKTVPQGISALMAYHPEAEDLEELQSEMVSASKEVITGEITYAVRDTKIDDLEISKDDIIAIIDEDINTYGDEPETVLFQSLQNVVDDEHEIITVYYGKETDSDKMHEMLEQITETYPEVELEYYYGGQPLYYYIFSVE